MMTRYLRRQASRCAIGAAMWLGLLTAMRPALVWSQAAEAIGSANAADKETLEREWFAAATRGDQDVARRCLEQGVDVNVAVSGTAKLGNVLPGSTAWSIARRARFDDFAQWLTEQGARSDVALPTLQQTWQAMVAAHFSAESPACVVMVARDGQIEFAQAIGLAEMTPARPADVDTKFRIGSVTKQFTAIAVLKLQQQGKLSVSDPIAKYLPEFPRGEQITLHHLLTHTSGLVNYTALPTFMPQVASAVEEEESVIARFRDLPLEFEPGARYAYCNSGYYLLGHVVRKVSGQSLAEYLEQAVFQPLEMHDTEFHVPNSERVNEAYGYSRAEGAYQPAIDWHMSQAGGAGAMMSNARDLVRWNHAVFSGKVLPLELLEQNAWQPARLNDGESSNYGYGWVISSHHGLRTISHSGGLNGFLSYLIEYPEQRATIVVLMNVMPADGLPGTEAIAAELAQTFLSPEMQPRATRRIDPDVSREQLAEFVGRYDYGGAILDVTLDGDQLHGQLTGQDRFPIYPRDAHTFYWRIADAEVEFLRGDSGQISGVVHRQNGLEHRHPRLPDLAEMQLSAAALEDFAGRYDYGSAVMTITRDKDQLIAQLPGQEPYPIFPVAGNRFVWKVVQAEVEFVRDEQGKVVKAIHTQNGRSFDAARMAPLVPITLPEDKLDEYVGRYNYGLLSGKMAVTREGKRLFAKLRFQSALEIVPVGPDQFQWRDVNAAITFERDEAGKVVRGIHTQGGNSITVPRVE